MQSLPPHSTIAVIGSGAMGAGIAQVAATAGHQVLLFDTRDGAADKAIADIGKTYAKLVEKGRMGAVESDLARERLTRISSLQQAAGAVLVIEAIVENLGAKRALFAELEGIVGEKAILATNTSSISVTAIGAQLKHPERLVGMHFFNPVPLMALVEVISGLATDSQVADTVYATADKWGKSPVHAKSTPGFIVNRVARPYYAEALRLLLDGVRALIEERLSRPDAQGQLALPPAAATALIVTATRGMVVMERIYRDRDQLQTVGDDLLRLLVPGAVTTGAR